MPFNPISGLLKSVAANIEHAIAPELAKAHEIEQALEPIFAKIDKDALADIIAKESGGKISHAEAILLVNGVAGLVGLAGDAVHKLQGLK